MRSAPARLNLGVGWFGVPAMNIAVLDDDQAHNDLLAVMLRQAGHRCTVYERPPALLADLRRQTFDLLIMDWNMPEMTGIDVLARLPELLSTTPPVLLVTSRSVESDVVEGLNAGADDYLVKPFEPSILLARVAALLRRAYPAAPPRPPAATARPSSSPPRSSSWRSPCSATCPARSAAISCWSGSGGIAPTWRPAPWTPTSRACGASSPCGRPAASGL